MTASTAPTSTVSSSLALISRRVPATGEGISVSTLSVDTSSSASSTATWSPTCLSQRVTVPSVTDSPSAGRLTSVAMELLRSGTLSSGLGGGCRSEMGVQRLAGQRQVRLAEGFVLGRVRVDVRRDVVRVPLPVVDQLGLADELTDAIS